jgi:hypothetical protein
VEGAHIWQGANSRKRVHLLEVFARLGEGPRTSYILVGKGLCERGAPKEKGCILLRLGQEEGAPKRGGTLVQGLHQTSQGFFKGGTYTSGKGKGKRQRVKERHSKVKRVHKELRGAFFKG